MAILSEQPYELTGIDQWYDVDIDLSGFTLRDHWDWCRQHDISFATDYRFDESQEMFTQELIKFLKTHIYASGPFDAQWYTSFHSIFVTALAKCWELDMGSMQVDIKQRYCRSLSMPGHGCAPQKITIVGTLLPGSKTREAKTCTIKFSPKFDHIDDWVRLITRTGKNGYIIAGPQ